MLMSGVQVAFKLCGKRVIAWHNSGTRKLEPYTMLSSNELFTMLCSLARCYAVSLILCQG